MIGIKIITWMLSFLLVFASCTNSHSGRANTSKPETIILGFELGMDKKQFYDSLQKRIESGIVFEITSDFDNENNLRRFNYPLNTVNSNVNFIFLSNDVLFYEDKLMEFSCFMRKVGPKDSVEIAFTDVLDLFLIKYREYQYQYGYESDRLAELGIDMELKYEQLEYTWSNSKTNIEITSVLTAWLMVGDHYRTFPIKNYEDIESDRYSKVMTIRYTNEALRNKKENTEKQEEENIKRKKYQKADSLSKLI